MSSCLNPNCAKTFKPGHYGPLQKICGRLECKKWYKVYYKEMRKRPRGIPKEDFDKILTALRGDPGKQSYVVVASHSGLRKGEQLGLTWADVLDGGKVKSSFDLVRQWSDAEGFKTTKTGKSRTGFLLDETRVGIEALLKSKAGKVNPKDRLWSFSEKTTWRWFVRLQEKLGISNPDTGRPYRIHDLRHSAAIWVYTSTKDINNAMLLLGHKNIQTTKIYTTERPEEAATRMDEAIRKGRKV